MGKGGFCRIQNKVPDNPFPAEEGICTYFAEIIFGLNIVIPYHAPPAPASRKKRSERCLAGIPQTTGICLFTLGGIGISTAAR